MSQSNFYPSDSEMMMEFEDLEDELARVEAASMQARVIEKQGRDIYRAIMTLDNGAPSARTLRVRKQLLTKLQSLLSSGALAGPLHEPVGEEHFELIKFYNLVIRPRDSIESSQTMPAELRRNSIISVSDDDDDNDDTEVSVDEDSAMVLSRIRPQDSMESSQPMPPAQLRRDSIISVSDDDDNDGTEVSEDEDSAMVPSRPFIFAPSNEGGFDYGDEAENRAEELREAFLSRETDSESEDEERFKNLNLRYI